MAKNKKPDEFFGEDTKFWMGRVVDATHQKKQIDGFGWGWRYKVRIFGAYTDESIKDDEVHTATAMLGVSDGSGGGGRSRSLRITQGDMVFGFYMAPDEGFPVIIGVFPRTREAVTTAGFTANVKKGLAPVEVSEQGGAPIPVLNDNKNTKGPTNPKETPKEKLQKEMGLDPDAPVEKDSVPDPAKPLTQKGKDLWDMEVGESALDSNQADEIAAEIAKENNLNSKEEVQEYLESFEVTTTSAADTQEISAYSENVASSSMESKEEMYYATGKKFQSGSYDIDDDFKMPPKYTDTAKTQLNPAWIEEQRLNSEALDIF